MTVYIEKPALNLRERFAALANQPQYSQQQFWFDGVVTNGTFATDTDWTKGGSWSISSGSATQPSGASSDYLTQSDILTVGKVYAYSVDVVSGSASNFPQLYTEAGFLVSLAAGVGTYAGTFVATGNDFRVRGVSTSLDVTIDNVSVFETDGTDVIHTMPYGWKPRDVFADGLLQREGAAHDYEVVYDGFDYKVKPAVAPSATTKTCVIGVKA